MPFYHHPKLFTPLSVAAEKRSIKNGLHHSIFTSRFDKYTGEWKRDLKHGKGSFLTVKGKLYEGDWYHGFRHGFGTLSNRKQNGTFTLKYRGDWKRGKAHGIGWRYFDNGDVYCGFWQNGQRHGYGKMWYNNRTFYVGYWVDDMKEGVGMFVQENGNRYEGSWQNGMKHGLGRFYHLPTGQLQEGCWDNDVCISSQMSDIIVRQIADIPTPYPIPQVELCEPRRILEEIALRSEQKMNECEKKLKNCLDKM